MPAVGGICLQAGILMSEHAVLDGRAGGAKRPKFHSDLTRLFLDPVIHPRQLPWRSLPKHFVIDDEIRSLRA